MVKWTCRGMQNAVKVPNVRLKVLMIMGCLIDLVNPHIHEEVAVNAYSNLYYLPPSPH